MSIKTFTEIRFPVYPLRSYRKKYTIDKVTYIESNFGIFVLDNKNLSGKTLAERRSISSSLLYPLNKSYYTIEELMLAKHKEYIDSYGTVFKYKRTNFVTVYCHKVTGIDQLSSGGYLIKTETLKPIRYEGLDLYQANDDIPYVLVFESNGYIIYGFSYEFMEPTRIKI